MIGREKNLPLGGRVCQKEFRFDSEQEAITFWVGNRGEIIV